MATTCALQSPAERDRKRAERPSDVCVHELFEAQVERTPEAIAAVQGPRRWTYRQLNARANQLARQLRARGLGPDVPVGVSAPRSLELAAALLGVLKAGGACLPLDPAYPKERLTYMQADAQAPVLLVGRGVPDYFADSPASILRLDESWGQFAGEREDNLRDRVSPEQLAYVIYTSGSTGRPRGVQLPHRGLVNHQLAAIELYGLKANDKILQSASISFDISVEEMFPAWSSGGTVVFRTDEVSLQAGSFLRWIGEQGITVLDLPTAYWHELVHELTDSREKLPDGLRLVVVGGEKASATAFAAWRKLAGEHVRWINTYGPTETSVIATAYEPRGGADGEIAELPIGRAIANTEIYILDADLRPVAPGAIGEMYIGGDGLARGYLNRPELTAEKFIADPFRSEPGARMYRTADLGRFLEDGDIEFRGRTDHQVKIRGFRVEPGEIEEVLGQHPGVRQAFVLAREDGSGPRRLVGYVVGTQPEGPSHRELREFLKQQLPEYMIPSALVTLQSLPLTPNGKVDRKALPAPTASAMVEEENNVAARDAVEASLVKIWEAVFGFQPIGVRHNFFDLGGHSLLALRLMHRVEQAFGKGLPPATLFQAPTIEQLAAILRDQEWAPAWISLVPIQPKGSKPPFFCVHGLGGHVLRFGALARNLGHDQPFYGLQARGLDGQHTCLTRVEDMAAHYIAEMRSLEPDGPYYLGGYSFGGAVAFEMARQLRAAGQEVAFLGLLDAYPGVAKTSASLAATFLQLSLPEKLAYLVTKRRSISKRLRSKIAALRFPPALKAVHQACATAERAYSWPAYEGRVNLFRASEKGLRGQTDSRLSTSGPEQWEIVELIADHGSILREPKVRELAENLKACLERAHSQAAVLEVRE